MESNPRSSSKAPDSVEEIEIEIVATGYVPPWEADLDPQEHAAAPAYAHGASRALRWSLVRGLVVVLALLGCGFFVINSALNAVEPGNPMARDGDNLKGLMKFFVAGLSEQKPVPSSVGHEFWIALFTGDDALDSEDAYLMPGDAGVLVCPEDPIGDVEEAIRILEAAKQARDPSRAVYPSGQTIACYGGPRAGVMRGDFLDLSRQVVGCTGQRNGVTFYGDGFNVMWGNVKTERLRFDKLETDPEWGGGWAAVKAGAPLVTAASGLAVGPMQTIDPTTFPD